MGLITHIHHFDEEGKAPMSPIGTGSYTAKFTDGPLEGKTIRTDFTDSGEPQARLTIPAAAAGAAAKKYLYRRSAGVEFADSERPSAVDYRYVEAIVS
jgi:hypothetical protein